MLPILGAILGFGSSIVPSAIKYFQDKQDKKHELAILELQMKAQAQGHVERLEEINAEADIRESEALYKYATPQQTQLTGVRWIDAANALVFTGMQSLISSVRPVVTYGITGLYSYMKMSAPVLAWTVTDDTILLTVLGHWFGNRVMQRLMKK